ncbi:MAG: hypothetical protein KGN16_00175 [Burkholderiales bacterium]|nr:hypothetical protein [Burkholderiales bacterium]
MIAILASELDGAALALTQAWRAHDAVLVSARDLSCRGWVFDLSRPGRDQFVAEGRSYPTAELRAVLVRRPSVVAQELRWIAEEDRGYASAEINAFLVAWLHALPCIVINRPTATSLCGPSWSALQWQHAAARAGVRWASARHRVPSQSLLVCGAQHLGAANQTQLLAARRLADQSGAALLGLQFVGDAVASVNLQPRLADESARTLVLNALLAGGRSADVAPAQTRRPQALVRQAEADA